MHQKRNTIFISHASEDKEKFVRPLVHALKSRGLQVWYDENSIRLGESLRRSIDRGIAECTAGVVVLSPSFFAKEWAQRELDALYTAEVAGRARILPVWHEVDSAYLARMSPLMADRRAARTSGGVEQVANEIAAEFPASAVFPGQELASLLERFVSSGELALDALAAGCRHRFLLMNAFREEYVEVANGAFEKLPDAELEEVPAELDDRLSQEEEYLRIKHKIPENAYLMADEPVSEERFASFLEAMDGWVAGTLSPEDSAHLMAELDLEELDEYFVLLDIPNFSFSSDQRHLMERALVAIGAGVADGYTEVFTLCDELRRLDT